MDPSPGRRAPRRIPRRLGGRKEARGWSMLWPPPAKGAVRPTTPRRREGTERIGKELHVLQVAIKQSSELMKVTITFKSKIVEKSRKDTNAEGRSATSCAIPWVVLGAKIGANNPDPEQLRDIELPHPPSHGTMRLWVARKGHMHRHSRRWSNRSKGYDRLLPAPRKH